MLRRPLVAALLLAAVGCTSSPAASPSAPPATRPSSTPRTPSPAPAPSFDASRALGHVRALVAGGPREAGSPAYRRAAGYVAGVLRELGYRVTTQPVALPAGTSQGVAVPAGTTVNVVAEPRGLDPASPHLLVGAHLDTVAVSPGANDNGSGVAVLLELARLASLSPPVMPVVWVAFGGEERRAPGPAGATFGSRALRDRLSPGESLALRGMLSIDMVGNGRLVLVCHGGITRRGLVDALLAAARRLGVPASERVVGGLFSDHGPFEAAGYTVAWLWTGDHPTLHTPRDTLDVVQPAALEAVGRVAWEALRGLRL
jgi:Zn-dependent M28 family amino/carboxypeptidase